MATLADFDPKRNGITAVRLALALTVVVSHGFHIGAFGLEPLVAETRGATSLGFLAVVAFFALSGFLLARSRERTPVGPFLRNRALRILPGYWLALLLTAVVFAPLASVVTGVGYDPAETLRYVGAHALFMREGPGTTIAAFGGATVNGSLWTLGVELLCYVLLAMIPVRLMRPVVGGEVVALAVLVILTPAMQGPDTALLLSFALGACAWMWRERIPLTPATVAVAVVGTVAILANGSLLLAVPLVVYLAVAAAWLPVHVERDLSYGAYVLAFPVQTLLALAGARALGWPVMTGVSIVVILGLAWCSWTLVERPALSRRASRRLCAR